ncbi:putative GMC oxidoreductase [Daldinia loculata]|uniref:putative GMC oxidoreductase n=1 Tax=Daldinia loculata TaxID=103429 RepID=UPI0020C4885F|nr:putative GMC oxidoreductase [Daldinia loculata]KAI1645100.1 putative GMC oxidoreductase [Daldinia loculata]
MASTYDFVIVGSGPAGSAVAAWLAKSAKKPKVLLLEAGGKNDDKDLRIDGQRWTTFRNEALNWGYKTVPQEFCNNRELDYSRGLGLGGSSAVNFSVFTVGASRDYDEWSRIVGDDAFNWAHMQRRFKSLESFDRTLPPGIDSRYAAPKAEDHGSSGPLKTGYVAEAEKDIAPLLDAFEKVGYPLNPDHNSGNPIGFSLGINSSSKGVRSTAADLFTLAPENLTIITESPVQRLILEGNRAVGVDSNGKRYLASKEVILSAGSANDPKILMHSGIGPRTQLEKYGIPVVKDVPAIGQGLRDHMFIPLAYTRAEGTTDRASFYGDKKAMADALEQWKKDGSGPWAKYACQLPIGWFKLDKLLASQEFQDLPASEKDLINDPTVPHYELLSHFPLHWFVPDFPDSALNYSALLVFLFNAQSRGEVTLQSADPDAALRIDPKFLATAFDRRAAIEGLRDVLRFVRSEGYARDNVSTITGPASDSDADLLEYWRQTIGSSWHMTGTVKMGRPGSADAAVDNNFRLIGFEGLRVADMSVVPVLASCHVQCVAYLTGIACAEKLISEYDLA